MTQVVARLDGSRQSANFSRRIEAYIEAGSKYAAVFQQHREHDRSMHTA